MGPFIPPLGWKFGCRGHRLQSSTLVMLLERRHFLSLALKNHETNLYDGAVKVFQLHPLRLLYYKTHPLEEPLEEV